MSINNSISSFNFQVYDEGRLHPLTRLTKLNPDAKKTALILSPYESVEMRKVIDLLSNVFFVLFHQIHSRKTDPVEVVTKKITLITKEAYDRVGPLHLWGLRGHGTKKKQKFKITDNHKITAHEIPPHLVNYFKKNFWGLIFSCHLGEPGGFTQTLSKVWPNGRMYACKDIANPGRYAAFSNGIQFFNEAIFATEALAAQAYRPGCEGDITGFYFYGREVSTLPSTSISHKDKELLLQINGTLKKVASRKMEEHSNLIATFSVLFAIENEIQKLSKMMQQKLSLTNVNIQEINFNDNLIKLEARNNKIARRARCVILQDPSKYISKLHRMQKIQDQRINKAGQNLNKAALLEIIREHEKIASAYQFINSTVRSAQDLPFEHGR